MASPGERMKQTFTYALLASRDAAGKPAMGSQSSAKCRHQATRGVVRAPDGVEQVFTDILYTEVALTSNHRVWVPGANVADFNQARRVMHAQSNVDGAGVVRMLKVFVG